MNLRRDLLITFVVALSACSAAASGGPDSTPPSPETAQTSTSTLDSVADTDASVTARPTLPTPVSSTVVLNTTSTTVLVGQVAKGNRVLMIGDSILASTSRRYGNTMCQALVPLGWQLELDAESGRFIDFGQRVLKARRSAGWDAVVIMLGNNFGGDVDGYRWILNGIADQLASLPLVLLTVTEFRADRALVNSVIRDVAASHGNVTIVDWAARTVDAPELLGADGLHLSDAGRVEIAAQVAGAMGDAPKTPGSCLPTNYTDDSAGPVTGTTVRPVTATTVRHTTTATTTRPATTTATSPVTTTAETQPPSTTPAPSTTSKPKITVPTLPAPTTAAPQPTEPQPTQPAEPTVSSVA